MSAPDTTHDLISSLPAWVQIAANFGIFVVAAAAAGFGYVKTRLPALVSAPEASKASDALDHIAEAMQSIAKSLETFMAMQTRHDEEDRIEREVKRRVNERNKD